MKFSEKLTKLRKEKGLSQEELADKLDVSRQSVSKWELGSTYPEMDKLLTMCKIFNVTLDDLTNDEVDFKDVKVKNRNYFDSLMDDFTSIIDNTYTMFKNLDGKQIGKVILELAIIFIVLLFCKIPFDLIMDSGADLIENIPKVGDFFGNLWICIVNLAYVAAFIFTFLYIYKTKFLDKYATIKVEEKEAENEAVEGEKKEVKEERIIKNRDNDNSSALFKTIKAIVTFFFKFFLLCIFVPCMFGFLGLFVAFFVVLYFILQGALYMGVLLTIVGAIMLCGLLLKILYSFIADCDANKTAIFVSGIVGLIVLGLGMGLCSIEIANTSLVNEIPTHNFDLYTRTYEYSAKDNIVIRNSIYGEVEYVEDESLGDRILIDVSYYNQLANFYVDEVQYSDHKSISFFSDGRFNKDLIKLVVEDLKDKTLHNYEKLYEYHVVVKGSKKSLDNMRKYYDEPATYYEDDNEEYLRLQERIDKLENEKESLKEENETLKNKINTYKDSINNL